MLNVCTLVGNLGQDPEVRYTSNGTAIANMSLAVTEHVKDADGNSDKRTHWFRLVTFGRTAEIAAEYLHKGSKIGVSGSLITREWVDREEQKRSVVEIRVNQLEFLETRQTGNDQQSRQQPQQSPPRQQSATPPIGPDYDADQDIPF